MASCQPFAPDTIRSMVAARMASTPGDPVGSVDTVTTTGSTFEATGWAFDPDTPAVVVAEATRASEIILRGTVADIAARVEASAPSGPVLVMIGQVLASVASSAETAALPAAG